MNDEEWMREHKGPLLDIVGEVWGCGDDCGCTQARVVERYRNLADSRFIVPALVWEGPFHVEHEPGAWDDLTAYRNGLPPEEAARIRWML